MNCAVINFCGTHETCNCSEQGGFAGAGGSHDNGERGRQRVAVGALDEAVGEAVCACAEGGDGEVLPDGEPPCAPGMQQQLEHRVGGMAMETGRRCC